MTEVDLLIAGGGPAGLAAAMAGRRAGLSVLLLEKDIVGGGTAVLASIESYPGVEKVDGWTLTRIMEKQVRGSGAEILEDEEVTAILPRGEYGKKVETASARVFGAKAVLVATGGAPKKLGLAGEDYFAGRGVHSCAQCAGPAYKGKVVAVCGNGGAALHAAQHLLNLGAKVVFVTGDEGLRGDAMLAARLAAADGFRLVPTVTVRRIVGADSVRGIEVASLRDGEIVALAVEGIFLYLGLEPRTAFLPAERNDEGFFTVDAQLQTSIPGIFAAGGAIAAESEIVIAAGEGTRAALTAAAYIAGTLSTPGSGPGKMRE
jgi:thioredoxin reductase (NADPH)